MTIAIVLIVVGGVALLVKLGVIIGSIWSFTWPVLLIAIGLSWLLGRLRHRHNHGWGWCCGPWGHHEEKEE